MTRSARSPCVLLSSCALVMLTAAACGSSPGSSAVTSGASRSASSPTSTPAGSAPMATPTSMPASSPTPTPSPAPAVTCPAAGSLTTAAEVRPDLLPDTQTLQQWENYMVGLGPRLDGSPALMQWHNFLAGQLSAAGLQVTREPLALDWWDHKSWSLSLIQNGVETKVPVASYYPYSGFTPAGGVVGSLADAGMGTQAEFAAGSFTGKIAFVQFDLLPLKAGFFYTNATYVYDPDSTLTPATDYKRAWTAILSPQTSLLTPTMSSPALAAQAGAIGEIISFDGSFANTEGQYLPFGGYPAGSQKLPTLYVDRATGTMIQSQIVAGAKARLELLVDQHPGSSTDDIIATLPGMSSSEVVVVNSHTDGTSSSEENGGLGVIALARYFAALPQSCRPRTMIFALTPGHFYGGLSGDTGRFVAKHPEIIDKTVGSVTIEHMGQTEWVDDTTGFHPTGLYETAVWFGSATPVQVLMKNAVVAEDLRRVIISRPIGPTYFGVGAALNAAGVPNTSYITGPNMLCASGSDEHLGKFDATRMAKEIRTFARVTTDIAATSTSVLCAGMTPSESGAITACTTSP